jgi:hypothetical protein
MKKKNLIRRLFKLFLKSAVIIMLFYVTSCFFDKIPQSYRIKDVSFQRIAIDEDSILSNKKIYLWTTQIEVGKTKILPFYYGGTPPFPEGCEDSIISLSIESEDGICLNDKFHSIIPMDEKDKRGRLVQLCGTDTINYVWWNRDVAAQKEDLGKGRDFRSFLPCCLLIFEDSDTIPHIIRFTFPDRKVESMVNNTPIHYKRLEKD